MQEGRKVVGVSLPPGAYAKLRILGEQLGLSDAGTAKHLIMMSLQQLMGQIQQVEQGRMLAKMADAVQLEMDAVDQAIQGKASGGASNTATTGQKCPPLSAKKLSSSRKPRGKIGHA